MRIAIVSDAAYPFTKGGAEKRYHGLALQLAAWGHQVDWYTMRYWVGERLLLTDGIRYVGVCRPLPFYSGSRRSIREAVIFGLACLRLLGRAERYDVVDCSQHPFLDRKSTRLNSSHTVISYAVFCLKKKKNKDHKRST